MKLKTLYVFLFTLLSFATALNSRKNKRFLSNFVDLELNFKDANKERAEQSKIKLMKLYENFDENERMAKILEIFNDINQNVMLDERALTNTSSVIESINAEFNQYLKENNIGENLNKSEITFNLQTNLSSLRRIKESLTDALFHFRAKDYNFVHFSHNMSNLKESSKELSWKLNEAIQRELNDFKNEQVNTDSPGLVEDSATNTSIQFDYLFNMLIGLKKAKFSHKLKSIKLIPKAFEPDLNSLQTKIGIQSRFVETFAVNASTPEIPSSLNTTSNNSGNSSSPSTDSVPNNQSLAGTNKSLEETLQDSTNLKENLKKKLDFVEIESNRLYDIYQRNKLKKMNMENFITEQIRLVDQLIHSQEKAQKLLEKMGYIQKEAERILNNFEKVMKGEIFDDYPEKNIKFKEQKTHSGFFDNLFSNKDFY